MSFQPSEICCFIGHRDIPKCDEQKIVTRVNYLFYRLMEEGVRYCGVGAAVSGLAGEVE